MHSSEAHTQRIQAQPQRAWEALSLSTGPGQILFASRGCGFTSGSLPQPLGPSARLVSAPHDCLLYLFSLRLWEHCVPVVSVCEQRRADFV